MSEFVITAQSNVRRFSNELHEQVDSDLRRLDANTLATIIYMLTAIAENTTIEAGYARDGEFLHLIDDMASAELWKTFITIVPDGE